jgi:hypothetical protein
MITPNSFVQAWRWERLKQYPDDLLEPLRLPSASKVFLSSAGLPERYRLTYQPEVYAIHLDPPEQLGSTGNSRLSFMQPVLEGFAYRALATWKRLPFMGLPMDFDRTDLFCVEERSGAVYYVGGPEDGPFDSIDFVNSSIPQYAEMLIPFAVLMDAIVGNQDNIASLLDDTEERAWSIDSIAMSGVENYWFETFKDIRLSIE